MLRSFTHDLPRSAADGATSSPRPALSPVLLDQAVARAEELRSRGQLAEAESAGRRVLQAAPGHAGASHLLGLVAYQQERLPEALDLLEQAVAASPDNAIFRSNLGVVLKDAGRLEEAVASYEAALRLDPGLVQVRSNLGVVLLGLGRTEVAIAAQREAIAADPDFAEAHANLGLALLAAGDADGAIGSFRRAVAFRPGYAAAHNHLAAALQAQGQLEAARTSAEAAIAAQPMLAAAHYTLGNILCELQQPDDAVASYRRALQLKPDPAAHRSLTRLLNDLDRREEAAATARAGLALSPDDAALHTALGDALSHLRRYASALDSFRRAAELEPESPRALSNLARAEVLAGFPAESLPTFRAALALAPGQFSTWSSYLFALNYLGEAPIADMVAEATRFGEAVAAAIPPRTVFANLADPARRLRVGLLSGDFREHPVARFLAAVLPAIDPGQVELFAYSNEAKGDAMTDRLREAIPQWREVSRLGDAALDALIAGDGIDILVDLSGHSARNRMTMLARKPAPVVVSWLGYFATTGLRAVDYVLSNRWVIPPAEENQWVEAPWRLPDTYLCFSPPGAVVAVAPPPVRANGFVTFGSANNINKLNDRTADCWARVLAAVPDSRLVLRSGALADPRVADATRARFAARGVAEERLTLERAVGDYGEHLSRYNGIDIGLDPFPYAGGTTSIEALWMGVPVLTLKGDRYVAHMGESFLRNLQMPEWIAADVDNYVARAAEFAADPAALATLRAGLRERVAASPLMDAPRFARNLDAAFRGMWRTWCAGQTSP